MWSLLFVQLLAVVSGLITGQKQQSPCSQQSYSHSRLQHHSLDDFMDGDYSCIQLSMMATHTPSICRSGDQFSKL